MLTINAAMSSVVALVRGRLHDDDRRLANNDRGATAVEYGLMVALIAAVIAGIVFALGNNLHSKFNDVNNCVQTTSSCPNQPATP